MRTIACSCDTTFSADVPDRIDLDEKPALLEELKSGSFMSLVCPNCGRALKPEFPVRVDWPSKGISILALPELDRPSFEAAQKEAAREDAGNACIVLGYPELADRVAVAEAGLDAVAVEAIKYYLLLKASEADPNAEASAWFYGMDGDALVFHVHGLRQGEVAVSKVPRSLYERTLADSISKPQEEPFKSLRNGAYVSVRNLFKSEA